MRDGADQKEREREREKGESERIWEREKEVSLRGQMRER